MSYEFFCQAVGKPNGDKALHKFFHIIAGGDCQTAIELYHESYPSSPNHSQQSQNTQLINSFSYSQSQRQQPQNELQFEENLLLRPRQASNDNLDGIDGTQNGYRYLDRSQSTLQTQSSLTTTTSTSSRRRALEPSQQTISQPYRTSTNSGSNLVQLDSLSTPSTQPVSLSTPNLTQQNTFYFPMDDDISPKSTLQESQYQQTLTNSHLQLPNPSTLPQAHINNDAEYARRLQTEADANLAHELLNEDLNSQLRSQSRPRSLRIPQQQQSQQSAGGFLGVLHGIGHALSNALFQTELPHDDDEYDEEYQQDGEYLQGQAGEYLQSAFLRPEFEQIQFISTETPELPNARRHIALGALIVDSYCGAPEFFASHFPRFVPTTFIGTNKFGNTKNSTQIRTLLDQTIFQHYPNILQFFRSTLEFNYWAFLWISPPNTSQFTSLSYAIHESTFSLPQVKQSLIPPSPFDTTSAYTIQTHPDHPLFSSTFSSYSPVEIKAAHIVGDRDLYAKLNTWYILNLPPEKLDPTNLKPLFMLLDPTTLAMVCTYTYDTIVFSFGDRLYIPLFHFFVAHASLEISPNSKPYKPLHEINETTIDVSKTDPAFVIIAILKLANFLQRNGPHRDNMLNKFCGTTQIHFNGVPTPSTRRYQFEDNEKHKKKDITGYRRPADVLTMTQHPSNIAKYSGLSLSAPIMRDSSIYTTAFRWYLRQSRRHIRTVPVSSSQPTLLTPVAPNSTEIGHDNSKKSSLTFHHTYLPPAFLLDHGILDDYYSVADAAMINLLDQEKALLESMYLHRQFLQVQSQSQSQNDEELNFLMTSPILPSHFSQHPNSTTPTSTITAKTLNTNMTLNTQQSSTNRSTMNDGLTVPTIRKPPMINPRLAAPSRLPSSSTQPKDNNIKSDKILSLYEDPPSSTTKPFTAPTKQDYLEPTPSNDEEDPCQLQPDVELEPEAFQELWGSLPEYPIEFETITITCS